MIISDLNYLEEVNQENAVVGGTTVTLDKAVDISVGVTQSFDVDVAVNIDKDINANLDSSVNIDGNFSSVTFDVTATGANTFTEADVSVITTNNFSEASGTLTAATA